MSTIVSRSGRRGLRQLDVLALTTVAIVLVAGCMPGSSGELPNQSAAPVRDAPPTGTASSPTAQPTDTPESTATPERVSPSPTASPSVQPTASARPSAVEARSVEGDDREGALQIASTPYRRTLDTTSATSESGDLTDCDFVSFMPSGATVWFSYTAPEDGVLLASTIGSDYDTTLLVGIDHRSGQIEPVDCNDDTSMGAQSAVRFEAHEDVTYAFMVGSYASDVGGRLTFSLETATAGGAPEVTLTLDRRATIDELGRAYVSGEIACAAPADFLVLEISLRQRVDRYIAQGWGMVEVASCTAEPVSWSAEVLSDAFVFEEARATVTVRGESCDEWECVPVEVERTVRLREE